MKIISCYKCKEEIEGIYYQCHLHGTQFCQYCFYPKKRRQKYDSELHCITQRFTQFGGLTHRRSTAYTRNFPICIFEKHITDEKEVQNVNN